MLRLHVAAENNNYDVCEQCIEANDDINAKTKVGK